MLTDLRLALRSIRREPVVCLAVVAILAVSIGVHAAAFALINATLLRPIADQDSERMVVIESVSNKTGGAYGLSVADSDDYLESSETFESIGAFEARRDNLLLDDDTVYSVPSAMVTSGVLPSTGVQPLRGRLFGIDDDRQGADSFKAVISHALWRSRFGEADDILDRRIRTSLGTYTVIGVLPPGFGFPDATQIWFPYQNWIDTQDTGDTRTDQRVSRWSEGIGRLAQGVSIDQARDEMTSLAEGMATLHPKTNEHWRPRLTPYREAETAGLRPHLRSLFVLTWVFLGLAVVTLASLQTARGIARANHFGLQRALGAQPLRLARQLFSETLLLAALGGALGLALASVLLRLVPALVQQALPPWIDPRIGWTELALSLTTVVVVSLLAGLAPLGLALKRDLRSVVGQRDGAAGTSRLRRTLVVAEVALATLLIVGALLLSVSFRELSRQDPGFDPSRVAMVQLTPQFQGDYYEQTDQLARFYERIQQELEALPGVVAVGGATHLPYLDDNRVPVTVITRGGATEAEQEHLTPITTIDQAPGYFESLGIELLEGRDLSWTDEREKGMVIVVSQRAADLLFPGRSALGQEVRITGDAWARIVGVVNDVRLDPRDTSYGAEFYYPITQYKAWRLRLTVRSETDPEVIVPAVRDKLAEIAPETGIVEIRTLDEIMAGTLWQERLLATLGPFFAGVSLFLAALGIYGLLRSELGLRRREFGLRAALGAPVSSLGGLVIGHGVRLVALGTALGLIAAAILGPALSASLFGVSSRDPLTYLVAGLVLLTGGGLACFFPALRAMSADPTEALRET